MGIRSEQIDGLDTEADEGNSATDANINWADGPKRRITLNNSPTLTFTAPNGVGNLILKLIQDTTGSRTVTWPATVDWPGGTAPTLSTAANAVDIVAFYWDGSTYFGVASLNFS